MIGVGCRMDIRQGQEWARRINMTAMGVLMTPDGCLETTMDFDELYRTASIGLDTPVSREEK
jgi:hypothetical protein